MRKLRTAVFAMCLTPLIFDRYAATTYLQMPAVPESILVRAYLASKTKNLLRRVAPHLTGSRSNIGATQPLARTTALQPPTKTTPSRAASAVCMMKKPPKRPCEKLALTPLVT